MKRHWFFLAMYAFCFGTVLASQLHPRIPVRFWFIELNEVWRIMFLMLFALYGTVEAVSIFCERKKREDTKS